MFRDRRPSPPCASRDPSAQVASRQPRYQSPSRDSEAELQLVSNEMRLRSCSRIQRRQGKLANNLREDEPRMRFTRMKGYRTKFSSTCERRRSTRREEKAACRKIVTHWRRCNRRQRRHSRVYLRCTNCKFGLAYGWRADRVDVGYS